MRTKPMEQQPARRPRAALRKLRAYRVTLTDGSRFVFVGLVRNREEARSAVLARFGDIVTSIRVHPIFDPWPRVR